MRSLFRHWVVAGALLISPASCVLSDLEVSDDQRGSTVQPSAGAGGSTACDAGIEGDSDAGSDVPAAEDEAPAEAGDLEGAGGGGDRTASGRGGPGGGGIGIEPGPVAPGDPIVHCEALRALADHPVVDGFVESGMYLERVTPRGWYPGPLPPGHELAFAAAWRPNGLYFYLEVIDPDRNPASESMPVWQGDAVEVFVDHDAIYAPLGYYDAVGTKQLVVAAPGSDRTPGTRADVFVPQGYEAHLSPLAWASRPLDGGYAVELFVTAPALGLADLALSEGDRVGLDVAHDVSHPPGEIGFSGNRLGQYFYRLADPVIGGLYDYPYGNSGVFCSPELLAP